MEEIIKNVIYILIMTFAMMLINVDDEVLRVLWYTNYFSECKFTESDACSMIAIIHRRRNSNQNQ